MSKLIAAPNPKLRANFSLNSACINLAPALPPIYPTPPPAISGITSWIPSLNITSPKNSIGLSANAPPITCIVPHIASFCGVLGSSTPLSARLAFNLVAPAFQSSLFQSSPRVTMSSRNW